MSHKLKLSEKEQMDVTRMTHELEELQKQEKLEGEQRVLRGKISTEKFFIKHHTLKSGLGKMKEGTKGYLIFLKKDVAPFVKKQAKEFIAEYKKQK